MKKEGSQKKDLSVYSAKTLFTYSTEHLAKKDKVRFYYALKGRDGRSGIVKHCRIEHLGRTVLLVPKKYSAEVEQFMQYWKCEYGKKEVLVR